MNVMENIGIHVLCPPPANALLDATILAHSRLRHITHTNPYGRQASLRLGLQSRKFSYDELVRSGILKTKTPEQLAGERASTAGRVQRHLQRHSAGSAVDLLAAEAKTKVSQPGGGGRSAIFSCALL